MRPMSRTLSALILVVLSSCSGDAARPDADAAPSKPPATATKTGPVKAEPAEADPTVLKVCEAFTDVTAEAGGDGMLLARTAVRATELGVDEAQLAALGSQPSQLLASIRARGNPPECAAFVAHLAASP